MRETDAPVVAPLRNAPSQGAAVSTQPAASETNVVRDDGASAARMVYFAYIIGFFVPLAAALGVLFAAVSHDRQAAYAQHFSFQIRTFWRGLLILILVALLWLAALAGALGNHFAPMLLPIGPLAWFYFSTIARVARGLRALNRGQTIIR